MRKTLENTGLFTGLGGTLALGTFVFGCVVTPLNGEDIGDWDDNYTFSGFIFGQGDKACVYANNNSTGTFNLVAEDTASSNGSSLGSSSIDGYWWAVTDGIPDSEWDCVLPLNGTVESFIKVQETDGASSCNATYTASQMDLAYTYDEGAGLLGCYNNNSTWNDFWDDCPVSDDAPRIRITADRSACDAQCTNGNASTCAPAGPCISSVSCNAFNQCVYVPKEVGATCNDGDGLCDSERRCVCRPKNSRAYCEQQIPNPFPGGPDYCLDTGAGRFPGGGQPALCFPGLNACGTSRCLDGCNFRGGDCTNGIEVDGKHPDYEFCELSGGSFVPLDCEVPINGQWYDASEL